MKTALLTLTLLLSVSIAHAGTADFSRDYQAPKGKTACGKSTDGTFGDNRQQLIHPAVYVKPAPESVFTRSGNSII